MIKKIITVSIPIFLISIILFISIKSYNQATNTSKNPLNIIPSNASLILKINNTKSIYNELNAKKIWKNLLNINIIDSLNNQLKNTSKLFEDKENLFLNQILYLSIHRIGADNTGVLFSSNFDNNKHEAQSIITKLFGNIESTIKYDKQLIYKIKYKKSILYASHSQDIIFYSNNKILIEDAIRVSNSSENLLTIKEFNNIYKTISNSASINLFINYNSLIQDLNVFSNKNNNFNLCEWSANDLNIRQNIITANGFNLFSDKNYTNLIKNQLPEVSNITKVIPNSTSLLLTIGYDNSTELYEKKNLLLQQNNKLWSWNKNRNFIKEHYNVDYNDFIKELEGETGTFSTSLTQNEEHRYTFFKSKNPVIAVSQIQGLIIKTKEYSDYSISQINDPNITANLFGDIFSIKNPFFTIIDDYFIFGTSMSSIEYIIDNYKRKSTLNNNKYFNHYKYYLSKKSNILFYANPEKIAQSFIQNLKKPYRESISYISDSIAKLTAFSIQMNTKKELLLNNINLLYDGSYKESIKEKWIKELDTLTNMKPQLVENHSTKEKFIIIQDKNNKLLAINNLGQELWNVQLNSTVLNNISVIDAYNNNKFQYLFNTENQIYLIDRNGENVEGFPFSLKTDIKYGHALFDYRKNKKYRILLVGKDNNIYNLDKRGKKVKGWKFRKDNIAINSYPKYFNIKDKDYILIDKNNTSTKLLAVNGSDRVTFDEKKEFNSNPIQFDSKGTLYAITKEGKLWQGFIDGNTSTISLPNLTNSSLLIQSALNLVDSAQTKIFELLFYTNNNKLHIVNIKKFKLIKEITFDKKIQKVQINNNLLCVSTTDQLYIYNNMNLIEGFPIESNGFFNIGDFNNTGKLNLIDSKNGFLYNYELSIE